MLAFFVSLSLGAAPTLNDEQADQRLEAAAAWAKKAKKPQLSTKDARAVKGCVELPAVAETTCTQKAKLCSLLEGDDGSSGTRTETLTFALEGSDKRVTLWSIARYAPPITECDPPEDLEGHESPEHHQKEVEAWRKGHAKEFAACLQRVKHKAEADAEELSCDLVLANACRKEAFLKCKLRNLRKDAAALEKLHRVEL
ncbi:MAG: hypothetical protein U0228_33305 [Myxococcaceae bacterium]